MRQAKKKSISTTYLKGGEKTQTKTVLMSNDHYFYLLGCSTVRMFYKPSQARRKGFSTPFLPSPLLPASSYSLKDLTLLKCVNSSNFFNSWKFQGGKMNPKQNSRCSRHRLLSSLPCETKWQRHTLNNISKETKIYCSPC